MKIVIFGANGKTGSLVLNQALERGDEVVAYVRRGTAMLLSHRNLKIVVGNLNEILKIRDAVHGADACISALGGKSLTQRSTDISNGIANIVDAMLHENVYRFVYLSSLGAGQSQRMIPQPMRFFIVKVLLRIPLADHNTNEKVITASNLRWTIVRPAGLTDGPLTHQFQSGTGNEKMKGNKMVSRSNVAAFMLSILDNENMRNKSVWIYE